MITHDLRLIADAMIDKKAEKVVSLDLRSIGGAITDFFMVCDGSNTTQVGAIADNIAEKMKEEGHTLYRSQGEGNNFWIIQDYGNIVVHIFLKEYRDFYRLEELWADVPRKEYKERKHHVRAGDSMYSIAQKYGIRLKSLYKMNHLSPDYNLRIGDQLKLR